MSRAWRWGVAAALILVGAVALSGLGAYLAAPARAPQSADVIVALGGDDGSRVIHAAGLYGSGVAPRVLLTGVEAMPEKTRGAYLNWRAQFLLAEGVPQEAILFDSRSSNSFEEARNTLTLMNERGWPRALVVSDPPHMRRLDWTWGRVFAGSGRSYTLVKNAPLWWKEQGWWRDEKSAQFVLMELIKLGYYKAGGRD